MFLVGLLGVLLGVIWWQLPAVLNWSLTQLLQQQGLTNITVEISNVGASNASIKQIDASYVEPDTELHIQLKHVRVEYSLSELIKGQFESLFINSITLKLDHQPTTQASNAPTLPTITLLLAAYNTLDASSLPINTVRLPDISFLHNLASESVTDFDVIELQADLSKHENQLIAKLLLGKQQSLHLLVDQNDGWSVHFFETQWHSFKREEADRRQAVFSGTLRQVDQSLAFTAHVKPSLVQSLPIFSELRDNSINIDEVVVFGAIKASKTGAGLGISTTLQATDLEYQGDEIQALNGQFDIQLTQMPVNDDKASWALDIKFDNTISLSNASFIDWRSEKLMFSANGSGRISEHLTKISSSDVLLSIGKLQQSNELELLDVSFSGAISAFMNAEQWQFGLAEPWQLISEYGRLDENELPQGLSVRSTRPTRIKGSFASVQPADLIDNSQAEEGRHNMQPESDMNEIVLLEKISVEIDVPVMQSASIPFSLHKVDAVLEINQARFHQGQLSADGSLSIPQLIAIEASNKALSKSQEIKSQEMVGEENQVNWRLDEFNQSFKLENEVFTSHGSVESVERDLFIETSSKHDLNVQRGEVDFRARSIKFEDPQRLNQIVSPFVLPLNLVAGELMLSGQARWTQQQGEWQTVVDINTQLINLGGAYDDTYFSGVNAKSSLQVYPDIVSQKPLRLTIEHVDVGVANTDMIVEFTVRPSKRGDLPVVTLLQARTQLLHGSMSLKQGVFDLNRAQHRLQVVMDNIDLSELVRVQQLDDIQATGLITGQLPMVISNGQVSIDNGQLQAIAPGGTLRYQADADAVKANKYAETVMLALRNFNYDALRADTYYEPDGTLLLKLQLQGNNPEFEQGRQVNLNINLEQNVLKLFESLRLIEGVSGTLDKRVQDFYTQTSSQ